MNQCYGHHYDYECDGHKDDRGQQPVHPHVLLVQRHVVDLLAGSRVDFRKLQVARNLGDGLFPKSAVERLLGVEDVAVLDPGLQLVAVAGMGVQEQLRVLPDVQQVEAAQRHELAGRDEGQLVVRHVQLLQVRDRPQVRQLREVAAAQGQLGQGLAHGGVPQVQGRQAVVAQGQPGQGGQAQQSDGQRVERVVGQVHGLQLVQAREGFHVYEGKQVVAQVQMLDGAVMLEAEPW